MNDVKNLIERIEKYRNDDNPFLYPDDVMTMEELCELMDYIHELEKKNKYGEQLAFYEAAFKGTELHKQYEEPKKDKKILVFKCNCRLKPETKESLRLELKRDIEEGVVVLDSSFDHPIVTTLPKDCEYEIFVESLEEETCE